MRPTSTPGADGAPRPGCAADRRAAQPWQQHQRADDAVFGRRGRQVRHRTAAKREAALYDTSNLTDPAAFRGDQARDVATSPVAPGSRETIGHAVWCRATSRGSGGIVGPLCELGGSDRFVCGEANARCLPDGPMSTRAVAGDTSANT